MKKVLKIALISLLSIITVVVIAVSILSWVVFTPEKLTPIVNKQLDKILLCEHQTENIELTFFSTFPKFGIQIDKFLLRNQLDGSPTDTVVYAEKIIASLDFKSLWNNNELLVDELNLNNAFVLAFTDGLGNLNYDVFQTDDTQEDTTAFQLPFEHVLLEKIKLKNTQIIYHDSPMDMIITLNNLNADLRMLWKDDLIDTKLKGDVEALSFYWDKTNYLQDAHLEINTPISFNLQDFILELKTAEMILDNLPMAMDAIIHNRAETDDIVLDVDIRSEELPVPAVFDLMELPFGEYTEGMTVDGNTYLNASIKGIIGDSIMPVFALQADFNKVKFEYESLPYKLIDMSGIADIEMDLNDDTKWFVNVYDFFGRTGQSNFSGGAYVDQLAYDMRFDVKARANLNLMDAKPILPDDIPLDVKGLASGNINIKFAYSDFEQDRYDKFIVDGIFQVKDLKADYDTIAIRSKSADLAIKIPNKKNPKTSFVELDILSDKLDAAMGTDTKAVLEDLNLLLAISNIMDESLPLSAEGEFSGSQVVGNMDDMAAYLTNPSGKFNITMDMQDSTAIPLLDCSFSMNQLKATTDSLDIDITQPSGYILYQADASNHTIPFVQLVYSSENLKASMGETFIYTDNIDVDAGVSYDETQENFLLQWIPEGYMSMKGGKIQDPSLDAKLEIPSINFDFTPDEFLIRDSKLLVDDSDFQLTGQLTNVQEYVRNEGLLKGDFNFRSNKTDVNQLMNIFNGLGYDEEELAADDDDNADSEEVTTIPSSNNTNSGFSGPFMVPKGMDISLYTSINEAYISKDTARSVQGTVTVKDGTLVLESMLFTTSAAKMQLTAMYKSPRKNHLYMGIDFHLLEIEIAELLQLIPDMDSIMPMLRSFAGKGEFHLAAETYTDSLYNLKKSTIRGASSVRGIDLVLMDGETFSEIAKTLRFNKKTENKIDSLSAEFTVFRNQVDVYPFIIVMDKYKAIVEGRHHLDMNFNYHISVIDSPLPLKLGVNVTGNLDKMKFRPTRAKYKNMYRPAYRNEVETKKLELRNMIRQALVDNVKEE